MSGRAGSCRPEPVSHSLAGRQRRLGGRRMPVFVSRQEGSCSCAVHVAGVCMQSCANQYHTYRNRGRIRCPREHMVNVWGYSHMSFMSPMTRFGCGEGPAAAARDFKTMVKE